MNSEHKLDRFRKIIISLLGLLLLAACGETALPTAAVTRAASKAGAINATVTPHSQPPSLGNIIPRPASETVTGGAFVLSAKTRILVEPETQEVKAIGQFLADHLNPATGYAIKVLPAEGTPAEGDILLTLNGAAESLGGEGYVLTVTPEGVKLAANQPAGLFYGVQTLRQMLPPQVESSSVQKGPWTITAGTISDAPRYEWRGAMLDVARHFFSVRDVTRFIDLLALYKLNHLHLHLTDDQGWRIQINSWPNLALSGGSLEVGGSPGGFYSQEDYAYLVDYARRQYITIVPEIDMPGHSTAALASYAELNCNGIAPEPYTGAEIPANSLCIQKDSTYKFLQDVIGEVAALTPGPYIHIGGDEAQVTEKADYAAFIKQAQASVWANGKQVIGWEEIAQAPLLAGTVLQHWNPTAGGQTPEQQAVRLAVERAVGQGTRVIMSQADKTYLDMKYDRNTQLGQTWAGYISVETAYNWDPAALVSGIHEDNILGVEAPLWSETLNTLADVEYMAFPRLLGYAEIGWTPQALRNWNEYKVRLAAQGPRLVALGVNFYAASEVAWPQGGD